MKQKNECQLWTDPKPGATGIIPPVKAAMPLRVEVWGYLAGCVRWICMAVGTISAVHPGNG